MEIITGILKESAELLNEMSVFLLFGFFVAGIVHVFLKADWVGKHLGKGNFSSVMKAALLGIPLPLCSCGVLPAALSLKKDGASKGAILSFLISTPTTGIDSIFATYALLGGVFAGFRVFAAFFTAVLTGVVANIFFGRREDPKPTTPETHCTACGHEEHHPHGHSVGFKIKSVFTYGFGELLDDAAIWLVAGILIGGAITYFTPDDFIANYFSSVWLSMLVMLLAGVPMYVCSSGSIPIAAALMMKGLNPGAAFVFLLTGPATNSAAITVIASKLGKAAAVIFLCAVIVSSFLLGFLLNFIFDYWQIDVVQKGMFHSTLFPLWFENAASLILVLCLLGSMMRLWKAKRRAR